MKLNISRSRKYRSKTDAIGQKEGLHKGIWYRHGNDDHDVHDQRYYDDTLIETQQFVILLKPIVDQVALHGDR
jgi:hypothetical protein